MARRNVVKEIRSGIDEAARQQLPVWISPRP